MLTSTVVSISWTSMNVNVTSLSNSRMRKVNYLALLNFKQSENDGLLVWYSNLHIVPQLEYLNPKLGAGHLFWDTLCVYIWHIMLLPLLPILSNYAKNYAKVHKLCS